MHTFNSILFNIRFHIQANYNSKKIEEKSIQEKNKHNECNVNTNEKEEKEIRRLCW